MAEVELDVGIPRFKSNEDRIDQFVNGPADGEVVPSAGDNYPTLRNFLATWSDELNSSAAGTLAAKADKTTDVATGARAYVKGADIASAATTDLSTATGDYVVITGTTTISALGTMAAGIQRVLQFAGALTLTHNATSLILPTAANIATAAGDIGVFRSLGSGNWRCVAFARASGKRLANDPSSPSDAIAGLRNDVDMTPVGDKAALDARMEYVAADTDRLIVVDPNDNVLIEVTKNTINHPDMNTTRDAAQAAATAAEVVSVVPGENKVVFVDASDNTLVEITTSRVNHPDINEIRTSVNNLRGSRSAIRDPQWDSIHAIANLLHIFSYGQSLSRGNNTITALTSDPLAYAYRFIGGVRPDDLSSDPAVAMASLSSFIETAYTPYNPTDQKAETPLGGCFQMIAQLLLSEDGIDLSASGQALLGSAPGEGGRSLAQLSLGTTYFDRMKDHATYGLARAGDAGRLYNIGAMLWLQGEQDYVLGTSRATYIAGLRQLRSDAEDWFQSVSGFSTPLPLVTYQTGTHPRLSVTTPDIALAQLDICDDDYVVMASPTYFFPYSASSNLHFTNVGSKWFGAYCGLALKRWLWDGVKPRAMRMLTPIRQGARIIVPFDVDPGRKLVIDATTVSAITNYGFTLVDSGGSALTISSVALAGPSSIQITAASSVPSGAKVRLGWIGDGHVGLTNIRDNSGDLVVFDPGGLNLPMHKWAPIDERTVA